jgi:hypothetical protein
MLEPLSRANQEQIMPNFTPSLPIRAFMRSKYAVCLWRLPLSNLADVQRVCECDARIPLFYQATGSE